MRFQDISHFSNTTDYLPILSASILVELVVLMGVALGHINSVFLTAWYQQYRGMAVLADVLILVIGIVLARFVYPFIFTKWSFPQFLMLTIAIQVAHDLLFAAFFNAVPKITSGATNSSMTVSSIPFILRYERYNFLKSVS